MCATSTPGRSTLLLVYDGDCGFCSHALDRLRARLPRFPPATPWQRADLDALGLSGDDVRNFAWLLAGDRRYAGHRAFSALLRLQERPGLRLLGWLLVTAPFSWGAALGYALVARLRHRLPGGTVTCRPGSTDA